MGPEWGATRLGPGHVGFKLAGNLTRWWELQARYSEWMPVSASGAFTWKAQLTLGA